MSPQPFSSFKGFAVTFRQMFKKPITQQYPDYKRPVYPRFRGRHRLWKHENGLEKCVGCSLCAAACPADCIRVVAAENTPENRVSAGERYARIYEINLSRCIFCGYCELACPFDAITLEAEFEIVGVLARRPHLHEGHAPRGAGEADAGGRPRPLRHAHPLLEVGLVSALLLAASASNILVWIVWIVAALALLASGIAVVLFANPFFSALALIGNLASLAVLYLLLAGEFVAGAQVIVYAGAIVIMFVFVLAYLGGRADAPWAGGPTLQNVTAIVAAAAIALEVIVVIALEAGDDLSDTAEVERRLRLAGADRRALPLRPLARLRGDVDRPPRRRGRGRDPRQCDADLGRRGGDGLMLGPGIAAYLILSVVLFATGAFGVLIRRSPLIILLALELMLNAGNLALIAFARQLGNADGQIFALTVMVVAAAEAVLGLGLIVAVSRKHAELDVDKLTTLRG